MHERPFQPIGGATVIIANAVAAATATVFQHGSEYLFYNSSATATVFIRMTRSEPADPTVPAATVADSLPIPPGAYVRLSFGVGRKSLSAIADIANGNLYVTPGHGN